MALEEKGDLDEFFVSSEEMRLINQLISSDTDISTGGIASPEQYSFYEGVDLDHSMSEPVEPMDSALFPEVDENKENTPPNHSSYALQSSSNMKEEKDDYGNGEVLWYKSPDVKSPLSALQKIKAEQDENGDHQFNPWICRICKKSFRHQYTLNRHLPTHTDERNYKCETCGKAFRQMSTLTQHRAIHSDERPYACPVCRKSFNRVSTLISHKKTHSDEKPHKCQLCGKAFHQKGNLRNHIFTHTNERPYKCNICGKGFNQMSNLVCHRSHSHAENSTYECGRCSQAFPKRNLLRLHEELVHGFRHPNRLLEGSLSSRYLDDSENVQDIKMVIDAITTPRMQETLRKGLIPFALLQTYNGQSMPVKLVPAPQEKLFVLATTAHEIAQYSRCGPNKIQIKLPMVAKIVQTFDEIGCLRLKVEPIYDENSESLKNGTQTITRGDANLELLSLN